MVLGNHRHQQGERRSHENCFMNLPQNLLQYQVSLIQVRMVQLIYNIIHHHYNPRMQSRNSTAKDQGHQQPLADEVSW